MPFSHSHKYVFVANFKTASTSLVLAFQAAHRRVGGSILLEDGGITEAHCEKYNLSTNLIGTAWAKHLTATELQQALGPKFCDYTSFAVVRNPWTWMLSSYRYTHKHNVSLSTVRRKNHPDNHNDGFEAWLTKRQRYWQEHPVGRGPQLYRISDKYGQPLVSKTLPLETLTTDGVAWIKQETGLELKLGRVNKTENVPGETSSDDYRDHYNDTTREMVADMCATDIIAFGYTFD